ncbi:transcriptional regulator [Devosia pacifica]|uniref:Transcriptional regulator n=1 Tax=Devosia pacifica TaxID=1335967 RepID=A0A918S165_9HYPH|nr:TetR/AcrR family transcriptional regulator [Devosia pacifica]GHA18918.1 transcriptional regulator [Devosia pacifica]
MVPTRRSAARRSAGPAASAQAKATRDAEATRANILAAGLAEFAEKGLQGARMDAVAKRAGCNKAMIYHYFSSKDGLFSAALEKNYANIREAERQLDLSHQDPVDAMRALIGFSFDYVSAHPEFISLINDENLHGGVHVEHSAAARDLNSPLVGTIREILDKGCRDGRFRPDVDAVQLYISIASICYFFIANRPTLSAIFDLPRTPEILAQRRQHVIDVVLGYLRPDAPDAPPGTKALTP